MPDLAAIPPMHLADWIKRHAITRPGALAIVSPRARVTYLNLHRALHAAAYRLAEDGVQRGQTIALCIHNRPLHCMLMAALNRLGCTTVTVPRPEDGKPVILPQGLFIDHVLVEQPFESAMPPGAIRVHADWLRVAAGEVQEWREPGMPDRDAIAIIFTSSGTTGMPKVMGYPTWLWESRLYEISIGALSPGRHRRLLSMFGPDTVFGYYGVCQSWWAGNTIYMGWPSDAVPALIAADRIDRINASPAQFQAILQAPGLEKIDMTTSRIGLVGGSVTPAPLVAAIRAKLCPHLLCCYGATEVGIVSFGPVLETSAPGHAGVLTPWIQAEVVDPEGTILPRGAEGILRFRARDMVSGYMNDDKATAEFFRDGWFYPGDVGAISANDVVTISGRVTERINAGGVKLSPQNIENAILDFGGVIECAAFGVPSPLGVDQVWAAIVADPALDVEALRRYCADRLGRGAPQHFLTLNKLPRSPASKVLRSELQKLAASSRKTAGIPP